MFADSLPSIQNYISALIAVTAGLVCAFAAFGPGRSKVATGLRVYLFALGAGGALIAGVSLIVLFLQNAIVAATLCALAGVGVGSLLGMDRRDRAGSVSLFGGVVALISAMVVYGGW